MEKRFLVFTDLDGTLLDEGTYSFHAALPALTRLKLEGHMLVFCTSKTFAECKSLQGRMGVEGPLIVENGGGIHLPAVMVSTPGRGARDGWRKIPLGVPYEELRRHLQEVGAELGMTFVGLGDGGTALLRDHCGLGPVEAGEAMQREFDEPFLMRTDDSSEIERVVRVFARRGLQVSRGGRFFHLSGNTDKGRAVRMLSNLVREAGWVFETVGLGDSPNDIPMLAAVERPFLVMRPGGFHDPGILKEHLDLQLVPAVGPLGWNQAILGLLAQAKPGHETR